MMKTRVIVMGIIIAAISMLMACNEKALEQTIESAQVMEKQPITELRLGITALNEYDQKIIFQTLPNEIKSELWKDRLTASLKTGLKEDQKVLIMEMRDRLSPVAYDSLQSGEFMDYAQQWYKKTEIAFARDTLLFREILFSLGEKNEANRILQQVPRPNCNCEMNAWFQCPIFPQILNCKPLPCKRLPCGPLLMWNCNGICD
ncbi:bacteriocin fulvocin C-related protein [Ulvibacterium marinum]|uniref:Uncharacterized protein n=1 Tax=Ulvibacterium marinum TaxID=2419782 RepID=A0A3B0C5H2_9FLAO|nr:bacteriocin fulvocin C-related protein [Ulvibacterium marinum]RKN79364.1 hypothetical protein D7Z94_13685 [Ulvibacterium marinum]